MKVELARTDDQIDAAWAVMSELRGHVPREDFVARVRRQGEDGYRLAILHEVGDVRAVAGFRMSENLAWGRYLYVDDLVTAALHRSAGYGRRMLAWLEAFARRHDCDELHLDSGVQRTDAHRFYEREGMHEASKHFVRSLRAAD